jgi:ribosomal protein S18 acetylase RimI-like enzyme
MLEITRLRADFTVAAKLMNEALGRGSFTEEKVAGLAAEPNGRLFAARDPQGTLLGVAHARVLPRDGLNFYRVFGAIVKTLEEKQIGSLFASAVVPAARGRGVGTSLARARLAWLAEQGCNYVIGISWVSGLPHTSRPVFERLGFHILGESNAFFEVESQRQGYGCPVCGSPCRCVALLYGRPL